MALRTSSSRPTRFKGPTVVTLRGGGSTGNDQLVKGDGGDVGLSLQVPTGQTANVFQIEKPEGTVVAKLDSSGFFYEASQDNIVALAGGAKPGTLITGQTARIITAATAGDSVTLPLATPGLEVLVINHGANAIQVFGLTTDTIDDVATATGVSQMANSLVIYSCATLTKWYSEGLATGYGGSGLQTLSFSAALTAHAGGTQALGLAMPSMINRVGTVATQGDSVLLPVSAVGLEITVINRGANPMQVFGAGTDTINAIATATGISQGVNTTAVYTCLVAGNWEVPITALVSTTPQAVAASGALPPHVSHLYTITKAGVAALTLAAPTAGTDDGLEITLTSTTAFAHTLTATGLLATGSASVNVATFAAFAGAGLTLVAVNGKWNVICSVGITFS